jgi:hypothetical protein
MFLLYNYFIKRNKGLEMKRRNFLQALYVLPVVGMVPSIASARGWEMKGPNNRFGGNSVDNDEVIGLKKIITIIKEDKNLNRKVDPADMEIAIECAERMNTIIIEAIRQTGAANDKKITTVDTREINDYIFHNYHDEWIEIHGDDEETGEETGFHKVRANGARTKLFGKNAINRVADSIYHLGFESHRKNRLLNEDGNKNASYKKVAEWLDALLREDLEAGRLLNPDVEEVVGDTDTGLDQVIGVIYNDVGLQKKISLGDIREGARAANKLNELLLEAISATNTAEGGSFSKQDAKDINTYLVDDNARRWAMIHGDDEENKEWGYHKVQNDGAKTRLYGKNAINQVFDGIYHLGFKTPYKNRLVNEDGDKNASFKNVALWLNGLLADDLANGTL